jgi:hypothetical protein
MRKGGGIMNHFQSKVMPGMLVCCLMFMVAIVPGLTQGQTGATSSSAAKPAAPASSGASQTAPAASKATAGAASSQEIAAAKASGKVWVNTESGVYHKGGRWYGKTKAGKFMTEAEAKAAGYKEAHK